MRDLIIVGTGYAGVWALLGAAQLAQSSWPGRPYRIAIVAPEPFLVARPRLYEADLAETEARISLKRLIDEASAEFIAGRVADVGDSGLQVHRPDGSAVWFPCRTTIVAAGSEVDAPEAAHNIASYEAASKFWNAARHMAESSAHRPALVVVGAGHAGLEAAAEAALMFGCGMDVHLVDPAVSLQGWSIDAASYIGDRLSRLGVQLHLGSRVVAADGRSVHLSDGRTLPADLLLWAAGMRPHGLAQAARGSRARDGRVIVDRYLRQPGVPAVFWAGDVAAAPTADTGTTVMSCQYAMQLGTTAGRNAILYLSGQPLEPFTPRPYVTCLGLGPDDGLFTDGAERQVRHTGPEGAKLKKYIVEQAIVPADLHART